MIELAAGYAAVRRGSWRTSLVLIAVVVVAWAAQALWLLVAWGYWIDDHRKPLFSVGR